MAELDYNQLDHSSLTPHPSRHSDGLVNSLTHLSSHLGLNLSSGRPSQLRVLPTNHTSSSFLSTRTQPASPTFFEESSCLSRASLLYRSQGFLHRRCRSEPFSTPAEVPGPSNRPNDARSQPDQSGLSTCLTWSSHEPREGEFSLLGAHVHSSGDSDGTKDNLEARMDTPEASVRKAHPEVAVTVPTASSSSSRNASSTRLQNAGNEPEDDLDDEIDNSDNEADYDSDSYMMSSHRSDLSDYVIPHVK